MFVVLVLGVLILVKLQKRYQLHWRRLVLPCLWGQANFSPEKWLISTGLGKTTNLKENQILKVVVLTH